MNDDIFVENGFIYAITTNKRDPRYAEVIGNLRTEKNSQLGLASYQLRVNSNTIQNVLEYINSENTLLPMTLVLDIETINNDEIMNAIIRKCSDHASKPSIRIIDKNYTLTRKDYDRLRDFLNIIVDNAVEELQDLDNIILQHGIFKYDEQASVQPVIERRNSFDELTIRNCFHIDHKLTDEEFEILSNTINKEFAPAIELDLFDPNYYDEFFKKLQEHNIPNNINVCLIGYPLKDESNIYRNLEKYPYEIDVVYSTCHDMVDLYTREPYVENKFLHSQIEGGGKTSLNNYANVVETLEEFQRETERLNLSPLEIAVYAKNYIDGQYIYDPDFEDEDTDDWDNTNLSQILNHNDGTNKRGICLGFATLYSALLRKCEIPMFRYTTTGHARNIGRIVDEKYGVDTISVFDITWDLDNATYRFFGIPPRDTLKIIDDDGNYENMTIASNLALPVEEYYGNLAETVDLYEMFYHPIHYNPIGYTARMLELMGYIPEDQEEIRFYEELYNLTKNGNLEGIGENQLLSAINNVNRKLGMDNDLIQNIDTVARLSFEDREIIFDRDSAVGGYNYTTGEVNGTPHYVHPLNLDNIDEIIENHTEEFEVTFRNPNYSRNNRNNNTNSIPEENSVDNSVENNNEDNTNHTVENNNQPVESIIGNIPGTDIPKPRYRGVYETDIEYERYLEEYYSKAFRQEETNENDNNYIPGTNIPKPRYRKVNETDEEYEQFLEEYYAQYFTEEQMNRGR